MFSKILFPIDLHEQAFSLDALQFAVQQAQLNHAELHVMTVLPHTDQPTMLDYQFEQDILQEIEGSARQRLGELIAQQVPDELSVTPVVHRGGTPYDEILRYTVQQQIGLIVLPSHDKSRLEKFLLGSCAEKVVRHAHCAVMVFRKPSKP